MMEIAFGTILSLFTGIAGHLAFYEVIEGWNNQRVRRLARPAIGVLLNAVPFLAWLFVAISVDVVEYDKKIKKRVIFIGFAAYCISFLWNGAGVALGYLIGDWKDGV